MSLIKKAVNKALVSSVAVIAPRPGEPAKNSQAEFRACGSGFILDTTGHVITNNHVVDGADLNKLEVRLHNGQVVPAKLVGTRPDADVAVLKIAPFTGMVAATLGDSDKVFYGDEVFAVGAPRALEFSVTKGVISHPERFGRDWNNTFGQASILPVLQTDTPINPGNSGGPLFDANGDVVGVNTFIFTPPVVNPNMGGMIGQALGSCGLGFALKINGVAKVAQKIIKRGAMHTVNPGFTLSPPDDTNRTRMTDPDARITGVHPRSPAGRAGLKAGDVITSIGGVKVSSAQQAGYLLFMREGENASVSVNRNGTIVKLRFQLPDAPNDFGVYFSGGDDDGNGGASAASQSATSAKVKNKDDKKS